jgi:hypothetical protein
MKTQLAGSHQSTYDAVFRHPIAHNLDWRDVRSMLGAVAEVVEQPNGNLKVSRNSQTLVLHPSRDKHIAEAGELLRVRHFLERSEAALKSTAAPGEHLLVVIDHRLARVYRAELRGSLPRRIMPYDPGGFGRHLHYVQDDSNGQRKPEQRSFYEAVATTLRDADKILVFGSGTGASSAMRQLLAELGSHHPEVAKRIVGALAVDEQHLTENQLVAKARDFYEHHILAGQHNA